GADRATVTVSSTPSTTVSLRMVRGIVATLWPSAKLTVWLIGVKSRPGVAVAGVVVAAVTDTAPSVPPSRWRGSGTTPPPSHPGQPQVVDGAGAGGDDGRGGRVDPPPAGDRPDVAVGVVDREQPPLPVGVGAVEDVQGGGARCRRRRGREVVAPGAGVDPVGDLERAAGERAGGRDLAGCAVVEGD